jgi:hypothetical protein
MLKTGRINFILKSSISIVSSFATALVWCDKILGAMAVLHITYKHDQHQSGL